MTKTDQREKKSQKNEDKKRGKRGLGYTIREKRAKSVEELSVVEE